MPPLDDRDDQLALLCSQLPRLRRMHQGPVGAARRLVLDRAVRAARDGEPLAEHLAALGLPVNPAMPSPAGPDVVRSTLPTAVTAGGAHAVPGEHVCPRGVCARRERRHVDQALPVCEVFDLALRFAPES
ncbi:hypothetical protein ACWD4N_28370 [Streptomyces sp. NPDC002586]